VEESKSTKGKAGIRVLEFVEAGGGVDYENRNSTVSRIRFGVVVDPITKEELRKKMESN